MLHYDRYRPTLLGTLRQMAHASGCIWRDYRDDARRRRMARRASRYTVRTTARSWHEDPLHLVMVALALVALCLGAALFLGLVRVPA